MRNFRAFNWYGKIFWFREILTLSMFAFIYVYVKMFYPFLLAYLLMTAGVVGLLVAYVLVQATLRWVFRRSWFRGLNQRAREEFIPTFGGMSLIAVCGFVLSHLHH
jgi:amino acid transporter